MTADPTTIQYDLTLTATEASTGFFACIPHPAPELEDGLRWLDQRPMDTFLFRYMLEKLGHLTLSQLQSIWAHAPDDAAVIRALALEASFTHPQLSTFAPSLTPPEMVTIAAASPQVTLRARLEPDAAAHMAWAAVLAPNLGNHAGLPDPGQAPRPYPYPPEDIADRGGVHITAVLEQSNASQAQTETRRPPGETATLALDALAGLNILESEEMRHESSLSPIGLLRKWRMSIAVQCGRHHHTLAGIQTSYGRGLTLDTARASYAMEIVERCSSFASIGHERIHNTRLDHDVIIGRRSTLRRNGMAPIDPNAFGCDVPYDDEPLHWMRGIRVTQDGPQDVRVPIQSVYLFTNLDEIELFAGGNSTGLASGNTMAEARLSGLMELVERDGEATHPFHHSLCFHVTARDSAMRALMEDYCSRGIAFQFQDISPPYGIPCCKCFVTDVNGVILKGTAANLSGRQAVLSALTETPFAYPYGPPSGPGMGALPTLHMEDLPEYASGSAEQDLALVERLLLANGIEPVYVDITRGDLAFPVVRAMLPGFALTADLDPYARIHPRLFANYLDLYKSQGNPDERR